MLHKTKEKGINDGKGHLRDNRMAEARGAEVNRGRRGWKVENKQNKLYPCMDLSKNKLLNDNERYFLQGFVAFIFHK